MSSRGAANQRTVWGLAAAVAIGAVALLMYRQRGLGPAREPRPTHQWFFDLGTRELFVVSKSEIPPVSAPSGYRGRDGSLGGVKAHVLSCGSCADEDKRFVGYLETYTPDARAALESMRYPAPGEMAVPQGMTMQAVVQGRLVASTDADEWSAATSDEGKQVVATASGKCAGGKPVECYPPGAK